MSSLQVIEDSRSGKACNQYSYKDQHGPDITEVDCPTDTEALLQENDWGFWVEIDDSKFPETVVVPVGFTVRDSGYWFNSLITVDSNMMQVYINEDITSS